MSQTSPRIGIIGTGAIGGFYGLMLARAGFDVHFLLRSEHDAVRANGLVVHSQVHGSLTLNPVQAYRDVADMPQCDWLLVGAKSTTLPELVPAIIQAAAPGARVLLVQNGLGIEDALRPALPDTLHLLGGLCFVCVHREAAGVVVHQAYGAVNLGYHSGPATGDEARQVVEEGATLLHAAGLDSQAMPDLAEARWWKLVWNVPYNGLSVLLGASTGQLMADDNSRALVRTLMDEVIAAAQACGHSVPDGFAERMLKATLDMPDYLPSMRHDFEHKRPLELEAIYARPLAAAAASGQAMPAVQALYRALSYLDAQNGRSLAPGGNTA